MFIYKIFKNKTYNTKAEELSRVSTLKTCPLSVGNIDELLQISSDEYILKDNATLVRVDEEIYIYKNSCFELLKEPLSTIAKRSLNEKLEYKIINYIDEIRILIMNASLNTAGHINLRYYNFPTQDILEYGFEKFVELLQSDGSKFEVTQETNTVYGYWAEERKEIDIKIKWL